MDEKEETVPEAQYERFEDDMRRLLLDRRLVLLTGDIGLSMAKDVVKELLYASLKSMAPVKVILNSVGGEVYAGLLIFNTIKDLVRQGLKIEVEARGLAASMGCIILQAGSTRSAPRATRFLIHEVSTWDWGKVSELEDKVEEVRKVNNMLRDIIAERTGQARDDIDKLWTKKDVWFNAVEAKDFGLIDQVIE